LEILPDLRLSPDTKALVAEFTGTFFLVFCGTGAIVIDGLTGRIGHQGIAITFGLIVMTMIYVFGDTSGAHFNPAVTLAFSVAGRFPWKSFLPYAVVQVAGAILASFTLRILFPDAQSLGGTEMKMPIVRGFWLELLISFILMLVIISVSTGSKEKGSFAGLAIGAVVTLAALFAGPMTGASMNPARSLGPAIASGQFSETWLYMVAPPVGTVCGAWLWNMVR